MMKKFIKITIITTLLFKISFCQITVTTFDPVGSTTVGLYEKFEIGIKLSQASFNNPYDPNEINISTEFVSPTNQTSVSNAFYYKEFTRCSNCTDPTIITGNPCEYNVAAADPNYLTVQTITNPWRVRFSPNSTGIWNYRIKVIHNNGAPTFTAWKQFTVIQSAEKGFLKVATNKRNFVFDDGSMFFPIGVNLVYLGDIVYNRLLFQSTRDRIDKISTEGGNFVRLWMDPKRFGIEWNESGVGNYEFRQPRAFDLDEILNYAHEKNVYIQLCLNSAFEFWDNNNQIPDEQLWLDNPYKTLLTNTQNQNDFFTDNNCREKFKQKLRYIIARWGYSSNLISYEMFNEFDQYRGTISPGFWDGNNPTNVKTWHNDMINYMKTLDNNHLYTTSTAVVSAGNDIYTLNNISYTQDHYYNQTDLNTEYQKNYLTNRSTFSYDKPYIIGEFSDLRPPCWGVGESNFTNAQYTAGNFFHDATYLHNGMWSTSLSGSAGSALGWNSRDIFNNCWGGQYRYFKPLKTFWETENLTTFQYKTVTNTCLGSGVKDEIHTPSSVCNCFPIWTFQTGNTVPDFMSVEINTSNDEKIEVFAIRNEEKVLGWVHNKDNYWYNLPHSAGPNVAACNDLNDNQPSQFSAIDVLRDEWVEIENLQCDGTYKIDFFSTYPEYDINNDNTNDDGGIIPEFTIPNVQAHCGKLKFTIPKMQALGAAPFAPDYGFKASKILNAWNHSIISNITQESIGGDISCGPDDIFYCGTDNRLHHYWNLSVTPTHEWLTDWNNSSQNVGGDIAFRGTDVFYKGTDSRLHHYWYGLLNGNNGWHHEWLTDWNNTSQNVNDHISFSGTDVFYGGVDGRLHHYWYGVLNGINGWHHEWLTDWNNNTQNVGGDIQMPTNVSGKVFYRGADNRLHEYYFANNQWNHIWHTDWNSNNENVGGDIGVSENGDHVFYRGVDNRLHQYYFDNNQWTHIWHTDWNSYIQNVDGEITVDPDGTQVFYRGYDGYVHQHYYVGNSIWAHDWVLCYDDLLALHKAKYQIAGLPGKKYFRGNDNLIHTFIYGADCKPRSLAGEEESERGLQENNYFIYNTKVLDGLKVYPNPFKDMLVVDNVERNYTKIKIRDLFGKIVIDDKLHASKNYFNINNFPSGVYFAEISNVQNTTIIKLVKSE